MPGHAFSDRPRLIPLLLIDRRGLFKGRRFRDPVYLGDPLNAARIFNDKEVDELIVLDATATVEGRVPDVARIRDLAAECFMPLCYGGGLRSVAQIEAVLRVGCEKVCIGAACHERPGLLAEASRAVGRQSLVACIDVRRDASGQPRVAIRRGQVLLDASLRDYARRLVDAGAGELLVQSIDRDGTGSGYDLEALRAVAGAVDVPVIAAGGAGSLAHCAQALRAGAHAAAAGSLFVFYGRLRAVLITYPSAAALAGLGEASACRSPGQP
ncbi:MAG: HisA/HisF-related TIM barrel protein [Planctomycetota bacterium]|nr:HisA/HisF-related TIM barrel protein [Planctomycetota bacterium]MCX8040105.1 HisA/HisF-related TIM barrel protein [Planctomycetota bacterium]MDW8372860.1 HisA/HisF-related TIM barrel protein [Planctomycetota bacterium]